MLRRIYGVYEFTESPRCLLRLRLTGAAHALPLPDGEIAAGAAVVEMHMWNEHMPRIPSEGADFAWAKRMQRMSIESFRTAAAHIQNDPRLRKVKAIGGPTAMLTPDDPAGAESLMRRLGFTILPYHSPLGRFGEFWENFYTWLLIWTFNAASTRQQRLLRLRRSEIWMSISEFVRRYGSEA
ncbi:MAG: hypothetical protein WEA61_00375 [Anaerolineales bacterium]